MEEDELLKECLKEFGSIYRVKHHTNRQTEEYWKRKREKKESEL